ncbi:MAG TPA: cyclic 2,3-diphosphoglycerate synthase [Nitrospiraceae bacterium]|nr:cyclic 2,3-diphosphoglycerate synthase [Nitrospiraceae bacterium]
MENRASARTNVVIMGAAGRDFHDFNMVFRANPDYEVVAFTAAQIPNIAGRTYPAELAGEHYPGGIPIVPEEKLETVIAARAVDQVILSYSDLSHEEVMHKASRVLAAGADFRFLSPRSTMLRSRKPVVSICAVRTGAGKSPAARRMAALLRTRDLNLAVVRHPMPYGDLAQQAVQRFATLDDLQHARCTIEEREEYEPHIRQGDVVFAGIDYERILRRAESEADVILWEGGNNDLPFFAPDLEIVLVDPHRAGHERRYFPGEVNLLRADLVIITKVDTADPQKVEEVRATIRSVNPAATIIESTMPVTVDDPVLIRGKRVLVVEDGPTVTHGGMAYGAGFLAAKQYGAALVIDPRPAAVGSLRETFQSNPHLDCVLPAMGYGSEQIRDLEQTINRVDCDLVLIATPVDLRRLISIRQPTCRVRYEFEERGGTELKGMLFAVLEKGRQA